MNISILVLFYLLLVHWIADFLFQTKDMATNKSKSNYWLFLHVLIYSLTFLVFGVFFFSSRNWLLFSLVTFICHFVTDYLTSRWTSKLYKIEKFYGFPSFFSVIGLDQYLHQIQLVLTYYFISNL